MDCNNARNLLQFARPLAQELDAAELDALHEHLEQCPECKSRAGAEQSFDNAVGAAMTAVAVPDGLRTRLMAKLDAERDAWYRRFGVRVTAAAAAILILAVGGWFAVRSWRVTLPVETILRARADKVRGLKENVDEWLRQNGSAHLTAPPRFNYQYLSNYNLANLNGRRVPKLLFVRGETTGAETAEVFILDGSVYNLEEIKKEIKKQGPRSDIQIAYQEHPGERVLYLILFTGSLDRFLLRHGLTQRMTKAHEITGA